MLKQTILNLEGLSHTMENEAKLSYPIRFEGHGENLMELDRRLSRGPQDRAISVRASCEDNKMAPCAIQLARVYMARPAPMINPAVPRTS
jgi:hypothetical protein